MSISNDTKQLIKIVICCILSFGPSLFFAKNDFVYDDGVAIVQNADVTNTNNSILSNIRSIMVHDFWGQNLTDERSHQSYRPLVTFMFHLEYRYLDHAKLASIMKRINLVFHIATCCIVYDVLKRALRDCHDTIISTAAILFAVHPIHTEVICSVVGRSDLICAFFFFATIGQYLDMIEEHEQNGEVKWTKYIILFDAALICLLCKEVGITVLPLCAVYDILMNVKLPKVRRRDVSRRYEFFFKSCHNVVVRCAYLTLMTVALVFLRCFCSRYTIPKFTSQENPLAAHPSLFTRTFSSFYVHALNAWLLICPDWLCCDWSHDALKLIETWSDHRIIFALILYAFVIRSIFVAPRHIRIALAFLIIPFIPSSNIITVGFVLADRVLYIPSLGYCLLISIGMQSMLAKHPKIVETFYLMLIALFVIRSNERSIDWQNNLNLFESAVRVCPNNAKIYYNLAQMNAVKGNHNKSLGYNLIANELNPNHIGTLINLGNAYRNTGHAQAALQYHKQVTNIDPSHALAWMNLGITYVENGLYEDALDAYLKADELRPNNEKITFNLGNLYLRMGNLSMAEQMYRKGIKIDPRSHRAHINLIVYLSEHGTQDELMAAIDNAKLNMFDNVPVLMAIARALSRINFDFERIEKLFHRVLEIEPKNIMAHGQLAIQYQKRNRPEMAIQHYNKARELNPSFEIKDPKFAESMRKWKLHDGGRNTISSATNEKTKEKKIPTRIKN